MKERFLTKIITPLVVFATTGAAFAGMDRDMRVSQLETQMKQVGTDTAMGTYGANTALARPMVVDGVNWFVTLDVLYWKMKLGGTEYAYSDQDPVAALPIKGRTKQVEYHWSWGMRVGLGYNFEHDGWDLKAQYTWFKNNGSNSAGTGLNDSLVPLRGSASVVDGFSISTVTPKFFYCKEAKSQYQSSFQSVDLDLGRDYFVSSKLSFHPFWGLKSAWIDLYEITRYTGGDATSTNSHGLGLNTVKINDTTNYWGLGPRTGIDSRWAIGEKFSIFGNIAGALLYGRFHVNHREKYTGDDSQRISLKADRHAFVPTVQYQLGLRWDTYFNKQRYHFAAGLGFEGQYFWRANQMVKIDDNAVLKYERYSEDLTVYGITLSLRFDF